LLVSPTALILLSCFLFTADYVEANNFCTYTIPQLLSDSDWQYIDCTATNCNHLTFTCPAGKSCILDCSGPNMGSGTSTKCYGTILDCTGAKSCIFKCNDGSGADQCRHAELWCTNGAGYCMIDCQQTSGSSSNLCLHFHQDCNNANPCYYQCNNADCGN